MPFHAMGLVLLVMVMMSFQCQAKLPPILRFQDGRSVQTITDWNLRKNEIREILQSEVYGYLPNNKVSRVEPGSSFDLSGVDGFYQEIKLFFDNLSEEYFIRLGLFLPKSTEPVPVFLSLNHCGNHTLLDDPRIPIDPEKVHHPVHCKDQTRGSLNHQYPVEMILKSGFGFITFDVSDVDADISFLDDDGIHGQIQTHSDPKQSWGTLIAWAWGLIKAVDYINTNHSFLIDKNRITVTGHSRRGKSALIAAAFDERIDIVIAHQSGTGGTSSLRNDFFKESTNMMANGCFIYPYIGEPNQLTHWFSQHFRSWATPRRIYDLPVDAHHLIALVAPRPLLDIQGKKDLWTSPRSAWRMMKKANKVYQFLGVKGFDGRGRLSRRQKIANYKGNLLQFRANTGHIQNKYSWQTFINFANR
jgi:hypothetical protein